MNSKLQELADKAEFLADRYALPDEFAEQFSELIIRDILDYINGANLMKCTNTTWDAGIISCARAELQQLIKDRYEITWTPPL